MAEEARCPRSLLSPPPGVHSKGTLARGAGAQRYPALAVGRPAGWPGVIQPRKTLLTPPESASKPLARSGRRRRLAGPVSPFPLR